MFRECAGFPVDRRHGLRTMTSIVGDCLSQFITVDASTRCSTAEKERGWALPPLEARNALFISEGSSSAARLLNAAAYDLGKLSQDSE